MPRPRLSHQIRVFLAVWLGETASLIGSSLTGFALGVFVLQRSGSVTQYALIALSTSLPGILFAPIAGALVDRWDRRAAMILSDVGAGVCTATLAVLFLTGAMQVWHIYLAMAVSSLFSAFQWPAYSAATTLLVPKEQLGRAGGMTQLAEAAAQILSPVVGGALMLAIGVGGVMLIDLGTLVLAVAILLCVRIPRPAPETLEPGKAPPRPSLLREAAFGWRYIVARRGLLALLLFFAMINVSSSIVEVLFTPLVLSFATPVTLGVILSTGGVGFLLGGLAMSAWGGPRRKVYGILAANALQALVLWSAAFRPQAWLLAGAAFVFFVATPITNGCSQAIWQRKVAPAIQGRVFAVRRMIAWSARPLAYLAAGPLADRLFEPAMFPGGALASSAGRLIGVGPGRGIALLFLLMSLLTLAAVTLASTYPRLRRVELELPDAVPDAPVGDIARAPTA